MDPDRTRDADGWLRAYLDQLVRQVERVSAQVEAVDGKVDDLARRLALVEGESVGARRGVATLRHWWALGIALLAAGWSVVVALWHR
jgi:hypothetical protein